MEEILTGKEGDRFFLLGNEAIVRGALEAGVDMAALYPGTPISEIGDVFHELVKIISDKGEEPAFYFEWSANEKVALDVCIAASLSGLRALCPMKAQGFNVASDSFFDYLTACNLVETDIKGGLVLVCADDPGGTSSVNEQDDRYMAVVADVPMLEPSNCQQMKDMTVKTFDIAEELNLPVFLRTTNNVNLSRGDLVFGNLGVPRRKGEIKGVPLSFDRTKCHANIMKKMEIAKELSEKSEFNRVIKFDGIKTGKNVGIVASGISISYAEEIIRELGVETELLAIGFTNPLPEKLCKDFIRKFDELVIVEELSPFVETQFLRMAHEISSGARIWGKGTGHFPKVGQYRLEAVSEPLASIFGMDNPMPRQKGPSIELVSRALTNCPGCPHRNTYYAIKQVAPEDAIFANDQGCYLLGGLEPYKMSHAQYSMGASVGLACGFHQATSKPAIAFIGDSTFYHNGMSPLANAVHHNYGITVVVMDNGATAMSGFQMHPGNDRDAMCREAIPIQIEDVARGLGATFVEVVNPNEIEKTKEVLKQAIVHNGVSVVVSKALCRLMDTREKRRKGIDIPAYEVDQQECNQCRICIDVYACPAFYEMADKIYIDEVQCTGCGICQGICPVGAIMRKGAGNG